MSDKIVLLDGHSILNRAFYGVPDLSNAEGLHTNAVYGFLNILFKILDEEQKALFSGDTLFCESYGRYDFPTSSGRELIASVKRLLKELPGDVTVYPGHNDETTIEHEKRYNPLA